jgi:hypothetical protein
LTSYSDTSKEDKTTGFLHQHHAHLNNPCRFQALTQLLQDMKMLRLRQMNARRACVCSPMLCTLRFIPVANFQSFLSCPGIPPLLLHCCLCPSATTITFSTYYVYRKCGSSCISTSSPVAITCLRLQRNLHNNTLEVTVMCSSSPTKNKCNKNYCSIR